MLMLVIATGLAALLILAAVIGMALVDRQARNVAWRAIATQRQQLWAEHQQLRDERLKLQGRARGNPD
jgi:hypothetical protein